MGNEDLLWAAIPMMGGISGRNKATCGAVAAGAIGLGLIHRTPLTEKESAKAARNSAREKATRMMMDFEKKFGHVNCQDLLGIDFTIPGAYQEFRNSDLPDKKCYHYVQFMIEKLYSFEAE